MCSPPDMRILIINEEVRWIYTVTFYDDFAAYHIHNSAYYDSNTLLLYILRVASRMFSLSRSMSRVIILYMRSEFFRYTSIYNIVHIRFDNYRYIYPINTPTTFTSFLQAPFRHRLFSHLALCAAARAQQSKQNQSSSLWKSEQQQQ